MARFGYTSRDEVHDAEHDAGPVLIGLNMPVFHIFV